MCDFASSDHKLTLEALQFMDGNVMRHLLVPELLRVVIGFHETPRRGFVEAAVIEQLLAQGGTQGTALHWGYTLCQFCRSAVWKRSGVRPELQILVMRLLMIAVILNIVSI